MSQKQLTYDTLKNLEISFQSVEHAAVFTVEEMHKLNFPPQAKIAKNLFLRDTKGKRHFLITTADDQKVDLKSLHEILGSTKLSFASVERLQKHLGLTKGSVTPFGLINDRDFSVEFYLDEKLFQWDAIGIHPNDNTATVFIAPDDLMKALRAAGHETHSISLD